LFCTTGLSQGEENNGQRVKPGLLIASPVKVIRKGYCSNILPMKVGTGPPKERGIRGRGLNPVAKNSTHVFALLLPLLMRIRPSISPQ